VVHRADTSGQHPGEHIWAIPQTVAVMAMLYRKDLFQAAGLDPQEPPRTWEQLLANARQLTIPSRQQYGIAFPGQTIISWGTYSFLVSTGARAVRQSADG
jgi:multiple sugar transport system substrate-binding protein